MDFMMRNLSIVGTVDCAIIVIYVFYLTIYYCTSFWNWYIGTYTEVHTLETITTHLNTLFYVPNKD